LSQYLKHKVKDAVSFITAFEDALIKEAKRRGFDGVVCGHIHKAQMREVDGILYCNDGDWVESLTALVEHLDGRLEIINWIPERSPMPTRARSKQLPPVASPLTHQAAPQPVEAETVEGVTLN